MKVTNFINPQAPANMAVFDRFRQNTLYYRVCDIKTGEMYEFTIPTDDLGHATVNARERAITLMRYIRKAIDANEMVKVTD